MDYKIGSLADLISGIKTPNKTKVTKKTFTPVKKEPVDVHISQEKWSENVSPKKSKTKIKLKNRKQINKNTESSPTNISFNIKKRKKRKADQITVKSEIKSDGDAEETAKKQFFNIKKGKKWKADVKSEIKSDSDVEQTSATKQFLNIKKGKKRKANDINVKSDIDLANSDAEEPSARKQSFSIKKGKKKKAVEISVKSEVKSDIDLADSDAEEPSAKKQKFGKNQLNAAGRIKNKINQEIKNSSEYKDKTIFVGNIPINIKKEKIKKLFRKYGTIDSVRIRGIPVADLKTPKKVAAIKGEFHPDRNSLYAFIRFINAEDAKQAEAENGKLFQDHHLRVHCCESNEKPDESKAIFVGNLPFNAEDEELWNLFQSCGPISHIRIVRDGRTAMSKGFGYVNFKDADSVQLALEMEKVVLKDRELRIAPCDSSRAKKKKLSKKPGGRNEKPKLENGHENSLNKKKSFKIGKAGPKDFGGSKFDDKKKKKKFSKAALNKKKLAQKLIAPKHSLQ